MSARFEFHLQGMDTPEGLIDADRLVEIVKNLQDMATRLGRILTDAEIAGRPAKDLDRIARLRVGLAKGSTAIIAERSRPPGAFEFDLDDEERFDRRFTQLFDGMATGSRPDWVPAPLAVSTDGFVIGLQKAAQRVEIAVNGVSRHNVRTNDLRREIWQPRAPETTEETTTFTGRLYAANLRTRHIHLEDDVGNSIRLPKVADENAVAHLFGSYVTATGTLIRDESRGIVSLNEAIIMPLDVPVSDPRVPTPLTVDEILASAPGLQPGGIDGLTDAEADSFFEAMGL